MSSIFVVANILRLFFHRIQKWLTGGGGKEGQTLLQEQQALQKERKGQSWDQQWQWWHSEGIREPQYFFSLYHHPPSRKETENWSLNHFNIRRRGETVPDAKTNHLQGSCEEIHQQEVGHGQE